jgi:hypothetical protein
MQSNPEKVEELRKSAELLAKQALETAELGIKLVRNQLDANVTGNPQVQNATINMETKAKEMFTLATHFMQELNDKWQPSTDAGQTGSQPGGNAAPKAEKINIDID